MHGFTERAQDKKLKVKNKLLKFKLHNQIDKKVRESLQLQHNNSFVYEIERVRYIEDEPTILEKNIYQNICVPT